MITLKGDPRRLALIHGVPLESMASGFNPDCSSGYSHAYVIHACKKLNSWNSVVSTTAISSVPGQGSRAILNAIRVRTRLFL